MLKHEPIAALALEEDMAKSVIKTVFPMAYEEDVTALIRMTEAKADELKTAAATAGGATGLGAEVAQEEKKKSDVTHGDVHTFRQQCEQACQREIDGRVVMLAAEGYDMA